MFKGLFKKLKAYFTKEYVITVAEAKDVVYEDTNKTSDIPGISYVDIPQRIYIHPDEKRNQLIMSYDNLLRKMEEFHVEFPVVNQQATIIYIDNSDKILFATDRSPSVKCEIEELSHPGSGKREFICRLGVTFPRFFNDEKTFCAVTMKTAVSLEGFFRDNISNSERINIIRQEVLNLAIEVLKKSSIEDSTGFTISVPKCILNLKIEDLGYKTMIPVSVTEYTYTNRNPQLDVLIGKKSTDSFVLSECLNIEKLQHKKCDSDFKYKEVK